MDSIITQINQILTENGAENVFSVFDAKPVSGKGQFFTVTGVRDLEWSTPIYTNAVICLPFKAVAEIRTTAPINCDGMTLCDYFHRKIESGIDKMNGMDSRVQKMALTTDKTLNRLVLAAEVSISGIREITREEQNV
ncbi:MAG: hypothetical protein J6K77_00090 [Ruminococcus sp.]|nr:hypothetical protein [Ruminococcus sp.]